MKIGILTFHRAKNYGAILQCYALSSFLKSKGYKVGIIDYAPSYLAGANDKGFLWNLKKYIRFFIYWIFSNGEVRHIDGFMSFLNRFINLIPIGYSSEMDAIVCGSDQIWSTKICGSLDPVFFGEVRKKTNCKVLTYAASNGMSILDKNEKKRFQKLLSSVDAISVREKSLQVSLEELGVKSKLVLDPVLLAGRKLFEPIICPIKHKKPYVLIYELTHLETTFVVANKISQELHADVLVMGGGMKSYFRNNVINKQGLSPAQFVSYFKNASCVVTTSFHGTAFSILYEKPFYSIRMNSPKDDRILSLLSELQLMERSVSRADDLNFSEINYIKVNEKLQALRKDSEKFLLDVLNS